MIKPYQKDRQLLEDINKTRNENFGFRVWWFGQSGYLVQWKGKHFLFDPYLSNSLTVKYAITDKPHVRMSELVIAPEALDFIDVITSSHNHTDHLDGETLIPLIGMNPDIQFIIPEANRDFVTKRIKKDIDFPIGLNDGQSISLKSGFSVHGIPAAHNKLDRNENGHCKYMGYVVQFGEFTIYHSGDTLWHQEILSALKPYDIDLALLPINGNRPERRVAGNLEAKEAVRMAKEIGAKMLIPCHYDLFEFNTVEPTEFISEAILQKQAFTVLQIGEKWSLLPQRNLK